MVSHKHIAELQSDYRNQRGAIEKRLAEFRRVPEDRHFFELAFCLLTPQSNAVHCLAAVEALEKAGFRDNDIDPEPFLGPGPTGYVRFHKTKSLRLREMKAMYTDIVTLIGTIPDDKELRNALVKAVKGLGYKEASHFLRNIGRLNVTILDRHIIRNFIRLGVLAEKPKSISPKRYLELETLFEQLAAEAGIPAPALDLLLWSRETGFILK